MRRWKVKLPGGHSFELDSDDPGRELMARGHTAFSLEEIKPPPPLVPVDAVSPVGRLTMSVQEAAAELGVSTKTVYTLIHRADFPTLRIGSRVRVSREGLVEWVKLHSQNNNTLEVS